MAFDYLIVGSGLTGATIARTLHDAGARVFVCERRTHIGGNVHDHVHPSGIRVHTYGPHYFRTGSQRIWSFATRFGAFYPYEARLKSLVHGRYENWPVAESFIRRTVGDRWAPSFIGTPTNFEEAALAMMPAAVYESFVKGYTEKQWGVAPSRLDKSLATRFEVRADDDTRLHRHRYQGLPLAGYAAWMANMLAGIPVTLNCDYLRERTYLPPHRRLVFTGPIDEFFDFQFGRLTYRGQMREHEYVPDATYVQPEAQVNNPGISAGPHIRTIEWKHLMPREFAERIRGTVLTRETTTTPSDTNGFEYPFPDTTNQMGYRRYRAAADRLSNTLICGRLGEYRYYDMDQAIGRALHLAGGLLDQRDAIARVQDSPTTLTRLLRYEVD